MRNEEFHHNRKIVMTVSKGGMAMWGMGRRTSGTWDARTWRLEHVGWERVGIRGRAGIWGWFLHWICKVQFSVLSRKVLYAEESVSRPVTDDFRRPWLGLICLLAYLPRELWVQVPTHFPARDHYEKYLCILEMKIKETFISGQRFSWSKHRSRNEQG